MKSLRRKVIKYGQGKVGLTPNGYEIPATIPQPCNTNYCGGTLSALENKASLLAAVNYGWEATLNYLPVVSPIMQNNLLLANRDFFSKNFKNYSHTIPSV